MDNKDIKRKKNGKVLFNEEQKEYIVKKYRECKKCSFSSLAKEFGVSYPTIRKLLVSEGVEIKPKGFANKRYSFDETYFEAIDSREKAYWLGFLYADGYVSNREMRVNLSHIDKNHLIKLKLAMKATHKIKDTEKRTEDKIYKGNYLSIKSVKLANDLHRLGCTKNKSLTLTFPNKSILPKEYQIDFIRGYFDGDGSLNYTTRNGKFLKRRYYSMSIVGTFEFLKQVKHILGIGSRILKNGNIYVLEVRGNKQIPTTLEILYTNSENKTRLDRKYIVYNDMKKYLKENPVIPWNKKSYD